jgi:hypothetical protein
MNLPELAKLGKAVYNFFGVWEYKGQAIRFVSAWSFFCLHLKR